MPPLSFLPPYRDGSTSAQASISTPWARVRRAAAELTPEAIEQIAKRVAQLLQHERAGAEQVSETTACLMDAGQVARRLGLTRAWVYQHADELGAIRVGTGPRARLRFDLDTVTTALGSLRPPASDRPRAAPRTQARGPTTAPATNVPLLPLRPRRVRAAVSRFGVSRRRRWW